jgi:hypothetical protein
MRHWTSATEASSFAKWELLRPVTSGRSSSFAAFLGQMRFYDLLTRRTEFDSVRDVSIVWRRRGEDVTARAGGLVSYGPVTGFVEGHDVLNPDSFGAIVGPTNARSAPRTLMSALIAARSSSPAKS